MLRVGEPIATSVRMRDGVRLATDLYLPDGWDRGPAVLVRLPYGKRDRYTFMPQCAPWFNDRGYAFVVQDVRGKGESEGSTDHIVHEVPDHFVQRISSWRSFPLSISRTRQIIQSDPASATA